MEIRFASMSISRDISKSFFNFIFKSILEASKKTPIISLWFIVWHIYSIVKSNQDQDYWSSIWLSHLACTRQDSRLPNY